MRRSSASYRRAYEAEVRIVEVKHIGRHVLTTKAESPEEFHAGKAKPWAAVAQDWSAGRVEHFISVRQAGGRQVKGPLLLAIVAPLRREHTR